MLGLLVGDGGAEIEETLLELLRGHTLVKDTEMYIDISVHCTHAVTEMSTGQLGSMQKPLGQRAIEHTISLIYGV